MSMWDIGQRSGQDHPAAPVFDRVIEENRAEPMPNMDADEVLSCPLGVIDFISYQLARLRVDEDGPEKVMRLKAAEFANSALHAYIAVDMGIRMALSVAARGYTDLSDGHKHMVLYGLSSMLAVQPDTQTPEGREAFARNCVESLIQIAKYSADKQDALVKSIVHHLEDQHRSINT